MSENRYYIGAEPTKFDSDETKNKLIQRLRQYLDLRNVTVLIGNGCSIPLGAPVIHDTNRIKDELDQESYRLSDEVEQNRARALLDILVWATKTL